MEEELAESSDNSGQAAVEFGRSLWPFLLSKLDEEAVQVEKIDKIMYSTKTMGKNCL